MDSKPNNCFSCKHSHNEYYNEELYCDIIYKRTKDIDIEKNCPIVELKPKQLVWEEYKKPLDEPERVARYKAGIYNIIHKKVFDECRIQIYEHNVVGVYTDTVDEAKIWCQDHYNKLFNEMIGG